MDAQSSQYGFEFLSFGSDNEETMIGISLHPAVSNHAPTFAEICDDPFQWIVALVELPLMLFIEIPLLIFVSPSFQNC